MNNALNKVLAGLAVVLCSLGMIVTAADNIVTADPANPGKTRVSSIAVSSTQITNANSVTALAVVGVTTSAGAGDSNKVVKLNASGKIDSTMLTSSASSLISTNISSATGSGSSYVWTTIASLATTATNGTVTIEGRAITAGNVHGWIRVRDVTSNIVSQVYESSGSITKGISLNTVLVDSLSGVSKTYYLDVASSGTSVAWTNQAPADSQSPISVGATNGLGLRIIQHP